MKVRLCELCNAKAAVFCPSDAAFLCWTCDAKVHEANFLVARHVRLGVCSNCRSFTADLVAGVGPRPSANCRSCPPESAEEDDLGSISSTSSSACASSTTTSPPEKVYSGDSSSSSRRRTSSRPRVGRLKAAEGVFADWCGKLGMETGSAARTACRALNSCGDRWTALPFRVCLAAAMWLGLRLSLERSVLTWRVLKRLEEISGVPAKIIVAAVSKLERGVRGGEVDNRRRPQLEEGWAEC
ncbi:B-box zinc finger protein 32-like [Salvia miltiorrhiza]|uniref:B-box zinc finger protein 32-like n=1 Tax=Salvia miltiorrhiza TaxID=226208 RepID=UPI0025ACABC7|nr:B-box zinc finger protein 32-like [Salvia miltiorrhiza]